MRCVALKDGLVGKTSYVREGEEFEAAKCPSWAKAVSAPAEKKPEGAQPPSDESKGD